MENVSELLGAAAITGFAVWEVHEAYTAVAPSLSELRDNSADGALWRQRLLDADVYTAGLAALAGITASWLSKSWVPLAVLALTMIWLSFYHRAVLCGITPTEIDKG